MAADTASRTQLLYLDRAIMPRMSDAASRPTDEDLVEQIKTGDRTAHERAWEELYKRWFPKLRRRCSLQLGEKYADDVAHDILVRCVPAIRTFRGRSKFSTWIYRIAYNCIADKIRKFVRVRKVETVVDQDADELLDSKIERDSRVREPVTDREVRELVECVRVALASLPRETLTIIALKREKKTFKEIAEELDLSENQVTGRYYRSVELVERSVRDAGRRKD